jgi:hypothetical protein
MLFIQQENANNADGHDTQKKYYAFCSRSSTFISQGLLYALAIREAMYLYYYRLIDIL